MSKLKKKQKVTLIVVFGIIAFLLTVAVIVFLFYLALGHVDYGRLYNQYAADKDNFRCFNVTIDELHVDEEYGRAWFRIATIDDDDYYKRYGEKYNDTYFLGTGFEIKGKTFDTLAESDFFDVVYGYTVVTIYSNPQYHWHGYHYPVVGVSIGDKVYVDFETGYQNLLDYLKQMRKEYNFLQTPIREYKKEN